MLLIILDCINKNTKWGYGYTLVFLSIYNHQLHQWHEYQYLTSWYYFKDDEVIKIWYNQHDEFKYYHYKKYGEYTPGLQLNASTKIPIEEVLGCNCITTATHKTLITINPNWIYDSVKVHGKIQHDTIYVTFIQNQICHQHIKIPLECFTWRKLQEHIVIESLHWCILWRI